MESFISAGVVELRIHVFSKCDDDWLVVVGEVVKCCNMFRGEHGADIDGADEWV